VGGGGEGGEEEGGDNARLKRKGAGGGGRGVLEEVGRRSLRSPRFRNLFEYEGLAF
jgi:hypothetical protein